MELVTTQEVTPYCSKVHREMLNQWLEAKNLTIPDERLFSDCGLVVNNAAIGFLFTTNSKQAYIDHVAANPAVTKEERNKALDTLITNLKDEAEIKGCLMITVLAQLPAMKERFIKHEFIPYGEFTLFFRVLGE